MFFLGFIWMPRFVCICITIDYFNFWSGSVFNLLLIKLVLIYFRRRYIVVKLLIRKHRSVLSWHWWVILHGTYFKLASILRDCGILANFVLVWAQADTFGREMVLVAPWRDQIGGWIRVVIDQIKVITRHLLLVDRLFAASILWREWSHHDDYVPRANT